VETYNDDIPPAVIQAYQKLLKINFELHKPEVRAWLHSEDSQPELKEMLENLPCLSEIH
jgi:hypothetical protein